MSAPLRSVWAEFSVNFDTRKLQRGNQAVNKGIASLKKLAGAVGVAFSVRAVNRWANAQIDAADAVGKTAEKIGTSTNFIQQLDFIAQRAGTTLSALGDNVFEVSKRIREARGGTGEAVQALKILGLRAREFQGLGPEKTFEKLRDAVSGVADENTRLFVADKLFGGQAKETMNVLRMSGEEYRKLKKRAEELGGGFQSGVIQKSARVNDKFTAMRFRMRRISSDILEKLLPHFEKFIDFLDEKALPAISKFTKDGRNMGGLLETIAIAAGVVAVAFVLAFAKAFILAGIFIFLALTVQDLWTAFQGGESVFVGIANKIITWVDKIELALRNAIIRFQEDVAELMESVPLVGDRLSGFFRGRADQGRDVIENRMLGLFENRPPVLAGANRSTTTTSQDNRVTVGNITLPNVRDANGFMRELNRRARNTRAANP